MIIEINIDTKFKPMYATIVYIVSIITNLMLHCNIVSKISEIIGYLLFACALFNMLLKF